MNMNAPIEEPTPRYVYDAILRTDFPSFARKCFATLNSEQALCWNWYLDAIAYEACRIYRGENHRLVVNAPPRSLKSICISVAFVAWCLGRDPTLKFICASYAQDLADEHGRLCHLIMNSTWYQRVFPSTRLDRKKSSSAHFVTTAGGMRYATSVGGSLTGLGADIIIIDDPMKAADANSKVEQERVTKWFDSTLLTRLNDKSEGRIILVMQRLHVADLTTHVLEKGSWKLLSLPAIAQSDLEIRLADDEAHLFKAGDTLQPGREHMDVLDDVKNDLGAFNFSAQYLQEPTPLEGNLVRREWFRSYTLAPRSQSGGHVVISWDTAIKAGELNDYSVGTVWLMQTLAHGKHYYLLDVVRERMEYPRLRQCVIDLKERWRARTVLIEDKGSGQGLIQELKPQGFPAVAVSVEADKIVRFSSQTAVIQQGRVYLPGTAPWLDAFLQELMQFPAGRHDDQVDSVSQFLNWAERHRAREFW